MSPYRVPGERAKEVREIELEKSGPVTRLIKRFLGMTGCHACRFIVGGDGPLRIIRKGRQVQKWETVYGSRVVESHYVCEFCQSVWGKVVYR